MYTFMNIPALTEIISLTRVSEPPSLGTSKCEALFHNLRYNMLIST